MSRLPATIVRGTSRHTVLVGTTVAVAGVVFLPLALILPTFMLLLFGQAIAIAVAIAGLTIVSGLSGQLSLGHGAFMGVGAYTSAILVADHGWPWLATLPVSILFGFVAGMGLAIPALRVRGLYLALVTLSAGILFPTLVRRFSWLTGGANGKTVVVGWKTPSWVPFELSDAGWRLLVLFAIAAVCFVGISRLMASPSARALVAQRDNEIAALTNGVNNRSYRAFAFAVAASFGAIAGSMLVFIVPVVSPDSFSFTLAVQLITGLVVGGMTRLSGAVLGSLLVVWLPYYSASWSGYLPFFSDTDASVLSNAIYGVVLIVIVFTLPGGLASGIDLITNRLVRVRPIPDVDPTARNTPITPTTTYPKPPITSGSTQELT